MDQGLPLAEKRTGHLFHILTTSYSSDTKSGLRGGHFSPAAFKSVTIAKGKPWDHGDSEFGRCLFFYDTKIDRDGFEFVYNPSIDTYELRTHENPFGAWLRVKERTVLTPDTEIKIGKDKLLAAVGNNMIDGFDYRNFHTSTFKIRAINPERIEIESNPLKLFGKNERLEDIDKQTFMFRTHASLNAREKPQNTDAKAIYLKGSRRIRGDDTICEFNKDPGGSTWQLIVHTGEVYVRLANNKSHPLEIGDHICIGAASQVSIVDGSYAFAEEFLPGAEELSTDSECDELGCGELPDDDA